MSCVCGTGKTSARPISRQVKNERRHLQLPSKVEAVGERLQLLLSQPLLLLQVLLLDEQRGLGLDKPPVVLQLLGRQLARQEGGDQVLSAVQVILQIFGILPLFAQQTVAIVQRLLEWRDEEKLLIIPELKLYYYYITLGTTTYVRSHCLQVVVYNISNKDRVLRYLRKKVYFQPQVSDLHF